MLAHTYIVNYELHDAKSFQVFFCIEFLDILKIRI